MIIAADIERYERKYFYTENIKVGGEYFRQNKINQVENYFLSY